MTIKRTVNGQETEFELTHEEHMKAFAEYQRLIDIEDIDLYALDEYMRDPEWFKEEFGRDIRLAQKYIGDVADEFRERYEYRIDDDAKQDAILDAIFAVLDACYERGETYED